MAKYKKKPITIEATQWFKNGDHPKDDSFSGGSSRDGNGYFEKHEKEGLIVKRL